MTYRLLFEHAATRVDAERAHRVGSAAVRAGRPLARKVVRGWRSPVRAMGLEFPAVLGLAAGFDKDATGVDALAALGFGSVEIGTVTGHPQPGNPTPRLFRLPADRALVNRMGFNNDGAEAVAARLRRRAVSGRRSDTVLGVNIGKTKVVDEADAEGDYRLSARLLAPYADYLVVNVSSPNTPGLRALQAVERLQPILAGVRQEADAVSGDRRVPLLVKIAPDLDDDDVLAVADLALAEGLDGVVATNTTIARDGLRTPGVEVAATGAGGLSGAPLAARSTEVLRLLRGHVGDALTLVGVGGVGSVDEARERLDAGADLLQAYSAFIYEGPLWPSRVNRALRRRQ
ncbi:dihydroorotate dehydrogenase (quinone) [Marmoricola endophyticus]|uniref:Dihydroorotate dehydrogenase (quinone) n=1 Tax=Marmoricola endophyticus TaxID=2040280 RepID=A0A917BDW2_9ACTN|nr:quinone-dependent dihydroorotate dehydrogenase [Marmoricola endophyticus]GGF35831.1 dihydroorotate dehydrogenase (quinone) [Marmoricola endophyticus]